MLSRLFGALVGAFCFGALLTGVGYAEMLDMMEEKEPGLSQATTKLQSPMKLSGQVSMLQSGVGQTAKKDSKGSVYMPCKQKRGKSGYRFIELNAPGGKNWELVVNREGITPLDANTLRVKRQ